MSLSINSSNIGEKSSQCYSTLQDIVWFIKLLKFRLFLEYLEYNIGFVKRLKKNLTFSEEMAGM